MSAHALQPTQQDDPGQQAEDAQLYRAVLHELIHIGTDLARLTHLRATAQAQAAVRDPDRAAPHEDHTPAFDRTARAIRRCVALARTLHDPVPPARDPAPPRAAPRAPTLREVQDHTPHPTAAGQDSPEAPGAGLRDRPEAADRDAPDRDDPVTDRPAAAVIAEIRRDLALAAPPGADAWTRRTPADAAQPGTRAAAHSPASQPSAVPQPGSRHPLHHPPTIPAPPDPAPTNRAAIPRAIPPTDPGPEALGNAADLIASVPHHPPHLGNRWRPPPGT